MYSTPHSKSRLRRPLTVAALAGLVLTSCGGSDSDTASDTTPVDAAPVVDSGEAPIGADENGDVEFSDGVDAAIEGVGFAGIVDIAADQMDPKPTVDIDGNSATMTFSEGSLESDAWLPCGVMSALTTDEQTVTVVYPDGEQVCD